MIVLVYFKQLIEYFWVGIYLRILAIAVAYGGLVHVSNILGLGGTPWLETPITWRIGDVIYGLLDVITAIGLWQQTVWGIICFLSAIASQFLIYTVFIDRFAFTTEQRQTIYGLLGTEAILVILLILLFVAAKLRTQN